jgi:hypothetical protein
VKKASIDELRTVLMDRYENNKLGTSPALAYFDPATKFTKPDCVSFLLISLLNDPNYMFADPATHVTKVGFGLPHAKTRSNAIKVKYGAGIPLSETKAASSIEFGKFVIHAKQLEQNILNIKYQSGSQVPALPRDKISQGFSEFLFEVLKTGHVSPVSIKILTPSEKELFYKMVKLSGLEQKMNLPHEAKGVSTDSEDERFTILRGELIAGNNSEAIKTEFESLVRKFINSGKIDKSKGFEVLNHLYK